MDRLDLINYVCYYEGDYFKVLKAIKDGLKVPTSLTKNNCFTIFDEVYPKDFLNLKYPPFVIFYEGDLNLLKEERIGIVGSRKASDYALKACEGLVKRNSNKVIVSGLAKGVDGYAQKIATKTIGILGSGIDFYYPKENIELIKRVKKEGLLLSEYPGMTKPLAYHFPFRNRLIAALANVLYVMQSSSASGTMTTINEALELGKDVKVLPYDIFSVYGTNNNHLIKEGADIIEYDEIAI